MKRLFILVEGQTEQEFIKNIVSPYLSNYGILDVRPIKIRTSKSQKGGFVNYTHLKNDIQNLLKSEKDCIVTTMFDFFRHPNIANLNINANLPYEQQVNIIEQWIDNDINDIRFFSYIQMHEFEALLFSSTEGFSAYMKNAIPQITEIIKKYPNPEDINSSPQGAPSKRLLAIDKRYDKVLQGNLIAMEVGITKMLEKCPLFKQWIDKIISQFQQNK